MMHRHVGGDVGPRTLVVRSRLLGTLVAGCLALTLIVPPPAAAQAAAQANPGALAPVTGIDHVGMNVPDLAVAIRFFSETFGMKRISDVKTDFVTTDLKRRFRWHMSSRLLRLVMMQAPDGTKIELFQYDAPQGARVEPMADDIGATHVALRTAGLDRIMASLKAQGITILSESTTNSAGVRWAYIVTPWGYPVELVELPRPAP